MKYGRSILVCSILLAFILLSAAASGTPPAEVSIVPTVINTDVGNRFTINVTVNPAGSEICGAQYTLHFNPAILKAITQTKGSFLSQDGASTIEVTNSFNNTRGTVEYGETRIGVENGVENPGTLTSISFEVIGTGTSDLDLLDVIVSDPNATSIETVVNNGRCVVGNGEASTETSPSTPTTTSTLTPTPTPAASPAPTPTATANVETPTTTTPSSTPPPADIRQTPTPTSSPTETPAASTPGFEAVLSISALLVISVLVIVSKSKRRRK